MTYTGSFSGGSIYISSSAGGLWSLTSAPKGYWNDITSDSSGTYLAACQNNGYVYISTSGK